MTTTLPADPATLPDDATDPNAPRCKAIRVTAEGRGRCTWPAQTRLMTVCKEGHQALPVICRRCLTDLVRVGALCEVDGTPLTWTSLPGGIRRPR